MHELRNIPGVLSLHDLHIWQLVDGLVIASVHVGCYEDCDFATLAREVREVFHEHRIHSITIQPEFHPRGSMG